jgi:NhaA family Na+:H+ antiporter
MTILNSTELPTALRALLKSEAIGGIILMGVTVLALITANSALAPLYFQTLDYHVGSLSVLHWINDGLMALFFLLVGLEIKREVVEGALSTWPRRILPGVAAIGGMLVPALIYVMINAGEPVNLRGWAIPAATDIAFALGVLALLGPRVPVSLKIFLTALAIIDDLGSVAIIAVFYSTDLSPVGLILSALGLAGLILMNRLGVTFLPAYLLVGIGLWAAFHWAGVHATLAGVALALTIPIRRHAEARPGHDSPLHRLEHGLAPWVAFLVVPIFGFANAGLSFARLDLGSLFAPLPLGIALGLFVGKQIGVFGSVMLSTRLGIADLPLGASWGQTYGVALLCGIGFTMSLFIGLLAFAGAEHLQDLVKLGVIAGSLASALAGALVISLAPRGRQASH